MLHDDARMAPPVNADEGTRAVEGQQQRSASQSRAVPDQAYPVGPPAQSGGVEARDHVPSLPAPHQWRATPRKSDDDVHRSVGLLERASLHPVGTNGVVPALPGRADAAGPAPASADENASATPRALLSVRPPPGDEDHRRDEQLVSPRADFDTAGTEEEHHRREAERLSRELEVERRQREVERTARQQQCPETRGHLDEELAAVSERQRLAGERLVGGRRVLDALSETLQSERQQLELERKRLDHVRALSDARRHEVNELAASVGAEREQLTARRQTVEASEDAVEAEFRQLDDARLRLAADRDRLDQERAASERFREELSLQAETLQQERAQFDTERARLESERCQLDAERAAYAPRRAELERIGAELAAQREALTSERDAFDAADQILTSDFRELDEGRAALAADRLELDRERADTHARREVAERLMIELAAEQSRLTAECQVLQEAHEVLSEERRRLRSERERHAVEQEEANALRQDVERMMTDVRAERAELAAQREQLRAERNAGRKRARELRGALEKEREFLESQRRALEAERAGPERRRRARATTPGAAGSAGGGEPARAETDREATSDGVARNGNAASQGPAGRAQPLRSEHAAGRRRSSRAAAGLGPAPNLMASSAPVGPDEVGARRGRREEPSAKRASRATARAQPTIAPR